MKRKARLSSCQIRDESGNHISQCGIVFCEERGSVKNRSVNTALRLMPFACV